MQIVQLEMSLNSIGEKKDLLSSSISIYENAKRC